MSIQSRITRGIGFGALAVASLGFITPQIGVIGGGGYIDFYEKRYKKKREYEELKAKEAYEELLESAPIEIKKQAIAIVKPFAETKKKTPPVNSVDWAALEYEAIRVNALLALWQEQLDIEREDEEILFLM